MPHDRRARGVTEVAGSSRIAGGASSFAERRRSRSLVPRVPRGTADCRSVGGLSQQQRDSRASHCGGSPARTPLAGSRSLARPLRPDRVAWTSSRLDSSRTSGLKPESRSTRSVLASGAPGWRPEAASTPLIRCFRWASSGGSVLRERSRTPSVGARRRIGQNRRPRRPRPSPRSCGCSRVPGGLPALGPSREPTRGDPALRGGRRSGTCNGPARVRRPAVAIPTVRRAVLGRQCETSASLRRPSGSPRSVYPPTDGGNANRRCTRRGGRSPAGWTRRPRSDARDPGSSAGAPAPARSVRRERRRGPGARRGPTP